MGRYLRWSKCAHCGERITQTISMGNWHPAFGGRTSKTIRCETAPMLRHEPMAPQATEGEIDGRQ